MNYIKVFLVSVIAVNIASSEYFDQASDVENYAISDESDDDVNIELDNDLYSDPRPLWFWNKRRYWNCWKACGRKGGNCHRCGVHEACCRRGYNDPKECEGASIPCKGYHCCAPKKKVNGGFSPWSSYGVCSKTCGGGIQYRTRTCTNPKPKNGGRGCIGVTTSNQACNNKPCAVFSKWGTWSPCTQPCAGGTRTRTRKCLKTYPAGGTCNDETVTYPCNVEKCEYCEKQLEAGIILDRSGSVAKKDGKRVITNWHSTIKFVDRFLKAFSVDNNHVHYGVMRFSTTSRIDVNIRDAKYWHNDMIQKKLSAPAIYNLMPRGATYMGEALRTAKNKWYCSECGLRPGVPKVLVLFTDGKPNGNRDPITVAKQLKDMGVKIVTVGIGKGIDFKVLTKIASKPSYVFKLHGFDYLKETINKLVKVVCSSAV